MRPEDRQAPKLSYLKRANRALKRRIAHQIKVAVAKEELAKLQTQLQDLTDLNAGRIDGHLTDFLPRKEPKRGDTIY